MKRLRTINIMVNQGKESILIRHILLLSQEETLSIQQTHSTKYAKQLRTNQRTKTPNRKLKEKMVFLELVMSK